MSYLDSPALELTVAISEETFAQSWLLLTGSPATFTWVIPVALLTNCLISLTHNTDLKVSCHAHVPPTWITFTCCGCVLQD